MNCSICNHKVKQVDEKATAVIGYRCVAKGWDFSKLKPKQSSTEPLVLVE